MKDLIHAIKRGVPVIMITSDEEPATVAEIVASIDRPIIIGFDIVSGVYALSRDAAPVISDITDGADPILFTAFPTFLPACQSKAVNETVIIAKGFQRFFEDKQAQQAISNARNPFKSTGRVLILVAAKGTLPPPDLAQDILLIDAPSPSDSQRGEIAAQLAKDAGIDTDPASIDQSIKATKGLSSYATEQAIALSIQKTGIDTPALWKRWKQAINSTPGLSIDSSGATLDDIGGLSNIKTFAKQIMAGQSPPSAVVRIEEIEKAMAGSTGDSSGTSQSILGALLTFMQEKNASGLIALGPAGSGKSLCSTAIGSAGNVPTITLDLGALKSSLVGSTEANTRKALSTIDALAGENCLFVATCNSLANIPPELRRRFKFGLWFFDLPDENERETIWRIWLKRFPGIADIRPDDRGYTGAEIRTACELAHKLGISPKDAASYIVPVAKMAAETIDALRKQAAGRYISASYPGAYKYPAEIVSSENRKINLGV